jgi:hypothetical protein
MLPTIAITNRSKLLSDSDVAAVLPAMQKQIDGDFAPVWGCAANLGFFGRNAVLPVGAWPVTIVDKADVPDALGYHDNARGQPYGIVSVKPNLDAGAPWTTTLSHELLELLANPFVDATVPYKHKLYDREVCDGPEDDRFASKIDGVLVSDFVFPAWFGAGGSRYDYTGNCKRPFHILPGGYIGTEHLSPLRRLIGMGRYAIRLHHGGKLAEHLIPIGSRRFRRVLLPKLLAERERLRAKAIARMAA